MEIADATLGKIILTLTSVVFSIIAFWVNIYPFIDEDLPLHKLVPNPQWFLLFCGIWGLFFIGGLMLFTLYHIHPYL